MWIQGYHGYNRIQQERIQAEKDALDDEENDGDEDDSRRARRAKEKAATSPAPAYELLRQRNMQANQVRLDELGVGEAADALRLQPSQAQEKAAIAATRKVLNLTLTTLPGLVT